jgi:hypothetical protein
VLAAGKATLDEEKGSGGRRESATA